MKARAGFFAFLYFCVLGAPALLYSPPAKAGPFELLGTGPDGIAEIGARAARADDGSAAFYNPSGLAFGTGLRLRAAPVFGVSALSAQGQGRALENPFGMAFTFDATVPLEAPLDSKIRIGFQAYLMPSSALHFIVKRSDEPQFPYYDNRSQRLALLPAIALRLHKSFSAGAALNVLGGVTGNADVRPGVSKAPEPRILVEAKTKAALHLGLRYQPSPHVAVALAYRQRFSVPAQLLTQAEIGGVPMRVNVEAREALFDPHTLVLATSMVLNKLTIELNTAYMRWSDYAGPLVDVSAALPGVSIASRPPPPLFRDIISSRLAGAYPISFRLGKKEAQFISRAGLGFEPSILKGRRQGHSNFVDGHKTMMGLGAELEIQKIFALKALRIALGAGGQVLGESESQKLVCQAAPCEDSSVFGADAQHPGENIQNPGYPRLSAGGSFWSFSLALGADL